MKTQKCTTCGSAQELPAVFCGKCHSPLLKISRIFLLAFLTLTFSSFAYFGVIQENLLFAWPLYAYFSVLFVVLSYVVTRRHGLVTLRMVAWSSLLAYALWFFYLGFGRALTNLTSDVRDVIDLIEQDTFAIVVMGLVILLEMVLAFVLLVKRFGFATGYRVYATLLAAAALAGRYAFSYAAGETGAPVSVHLSDWFAWAPETEVKELFTLVALNIMRAMLAEIAVTSFIKANRPAGEAFDRYRAAMPAAGGTGPGAAMLDAASRLNAGLFRAALLLRHFFTQFTHALVLYLMALGRTFRRLFLDLLLPAGTLLMTALLLGMLTEHTATYITGRAGERLIYFVGIQSSLGMIAVTIVLLFMAQLVFLAAVTKFPLRALWRCNSLLLMWIAPFVVFSFVFISVFLSATGRVAVDLPYRLGILTTSASVLLVLVIIYAAIAVRRASGRIRAEDELAAASALPGQEVASAGDPVSAPVEPSAVNPGASAYTVNTNAAPSPDAVPPAPVSDPEPPPAPVSDPNADPVPVSDPDGDSAPVSDPKPDPAPDPHPAGSP